MKDKRPTIGRLNLSNILLKICWYFNYCGFRF